MPITVVGVLGLLSGPDTRNTGIDGERYPKGELNEDANQGSGSQDTDHGVRGQGREAVPFRAGSGGGLGGWGYSGKGGRPGRDTAGRAALPYQPFGARRGCLGSIHRNSWNVVRLPGLRQSGPRVEQY